MIKTEKLYYWLNVAVLKSTFDAIAVKLKSGRPRPNLRFWSWPGRSRPRCRPPRTLLSYFAIVVASFRPTFISNFIAKHTVRRTAFVTLNSRHMLGLDQDLAMAAKIPEQPSVNEPIVDEDCLELEENISIGDNISDHMSGYASDVSEICVVFDNKVEQSRAAVEILIDDDADDIIHNVQSEGVGLGLPRRMEDFIPLQDNSSVSARFIGGLDHIGLPRPTGSNLALPREDDNVNRTRARLDSRLQSRPVTRPISQEEVEKKREELEEYRIWEYTNLGAGMVQDEQLKYRLNEVFTVMSYNVLAQSLLEGHPELYKNHDQRALTWEHRSQILFKELKMANPDILCLQEVQTSHMDTFYNAIKELGYGVVHKQRTGDKGDGVAIYYKNSTFALMESTTVEFFQPGVPILNRDNVGIVAKLRLKNDTRNRCIVVATTHLLFNPRRHDVKLAQAQILLAEVERFSYEGSDRKKEPVYCPSIITGDMNFQPFSGVYELLTNGRLKYEGLSSRSLTCTDYGHQLDSNLIPHHLEITDTCQHFSILSQRPEVASFEVQRETIKLYSSEDRRRGRKKAEQFRSFDEYVKEMIRRGCINNFTPNPNFIETPPSPPTALRNRCSTGQLSHQLNLRSVYNHGQVGTNRAEVTTNQGDWVTVDYIFYGYSSGLQKVIEGDLKLISRLRLPRSFQAQKLGPIPNAAVPSDHYPLAAVFLLK